MMTTLNLKTRTKIGSWNVNTMREPSRLAQIIKEMKEYKLDILGLSETRWNGKGEHTVSAAEDKDVFYEQLSATMMNVKKSDIAIIMGDLNAKVGSNNSNVEHVMGKHGLGVMDDNGESKKWKSSLQDVRVYKGVDVASDHLLVNGQVKLKITTNYVPGTQNSRRKYKTDLLKDKRINQGFEDKLQTLQEEIEENQKPPDSNNWNKVQNFLINACEDILGRNKVERKEWITDDTWNKIKERKDIKNKLNNVNEANSIYDLRQQHQAKNKEVKKAARRDKRIWLDTLAENAQKAADTKNSQELYRITKKLAHKSFSQDGHQIKNKDGLILTSEVSQLTRWTEYFSETLTVPLSLHPILMYQRNSQTNLELILRNLPYLK
ncbi:hypothetical protein ANN_26939 [Periplaneta americana]|uniref:Endonuclease/exonuclease/phosphatase domain-containing protein n=1 Tax=Periplaneta americana TaxID=6978 RepID=A0ABQ8RWR9_PERAM|nr:hypothetical protein ANN_26939 [Periplaneta americana]